MSEIDRLTNTGTALLEKIAVSYLNEDIPVIIENVTSLWPNRGVINVEKLRQVGFFRVMALFPPLSFLRDKCVVGGHSVLQTHISFFFVLFVIHSYIHTRITSEVMKKT